MTGHTRTGGRIAGMALMGALLLTAAASAAMQPVTLRGGYRTDPRVIDTRHLNGEWLMAFHSDSMGATVMSGWLGLAWSDDLVNWRTT
jgi:hypothetical protein